MAEETQNAIVKKKREAMMVALQGENFREALKEVAAKHITPEKLVKLACVAASRSPKLFECTPLSFMQGVLRSAELGLDCSGTLGQAYLIPFKNKNGTMEVQFIAGYQGLTELVYRSGKVSYIDAQTVYENDVFEFELGSSPHVKHIPAFTNRGKLKCVYAVAEMAGASKPKIELMSIDQVNSIRARSKAKDYGPWVTDFDEMARKTVLRRIIKYLPKSTELAAVLTEDDKQFEFHGGGIAAMAGDGVDDAIGTEALKNKLEKNEETPAEAGKPDPQIPFGNGQ